MKTKPNSKVTLSIPNYQAKAISRNFEYAIDVPLKKGGTNTAPTPVEYFLTAIGACIAITLRMYAEKMKWDLGEINVSVSEETKLTSMGIHKTIVEEISIEKKVTEVQLELLKEMAAKCPVAQMVKNQTEIVRIIKNK